MSVLTLPKTKAKKFTYQDYSLLDDDTRYEVLQGELEMVPGPEVEHQSASRNLEFLFWSFVKEEELGEIFDAPLDVVLNDDNIVQPDIIFVAKSNAKILQKQAVVGVPDLVVEIISPSSIHKDRHKKKLLYEQFGVKEYWLVDPANKAIEVFVLQDGAFQLFDIASEKGSVKSKILEGFAVDIEQIF